MRVRISQFAAFRALTKFARSRDLPSRTPLRLNVVHITCYATPSYVIHFTGAPFGEAQGIFDAAALEVAYFVRCGKRLTPRGSERMVPAEVVVPGCAAVDAVEDGELAALPYAHES